MTETATSKIFRHANGQEVVSIGDRFSWSDGQQWEVTGLSEEGAFCKHLTGEIGSEWKYCVEPDGTVEWDGAVVASALARASLSGRTEKSSDAGSS